MIPEEDLIAEIHRLATDGSPPTSTEMRENGIYSPQTYDNRFGSWNNAIREAGYSPHKQRNIDESKLLKDLADISHNGVVPSPKEYSGKYSSTTYKGRFDSWWKASVRAGQRPTNRRPLTDTQFRRFFESATSQQVAERQLIALLCQFGGLPPTILEDLSDDWLMHRAGDVIVTVPAEQTRSGDTWTFKLPSKWTDDEQQRDTGLPGLLDWYFDRHKKIQPDQSHISKTTLRVAASANLSSRETVTDETVGTTPLVRPSDLRATGGVKMARNDAPKRRIHRHLGIKHTNWKAEVEDFLLYAYVHHGHKHPDFKLPDVVLDPP